VAFEDNLTERLTAARGEDAMREQAADLSIVASHQALDRFRASLRKTAAFLSSHGVTTMPFIEESFKSTFSVGFRKIETPVAEGWPVGRIFGMALSFDGELWQTERAVIDGHEARQWARFDFEEMRDILTRQRHVRTPKLGMTMVFPGVAWAPVHGFVEDLDGRVELHPDPQEGFSCDLEEFLADEAVRLVREHSVPAAGQD
jgi:hypothetical protein